MGISRSLYGILLAILLLSRSAAGSTSGSFTMAQALDYPYVTQLAAAARGGTFGWVTNVGGARNVWVASAPGFAPRQLTHYAQDDGQEITQLTFSPDGIRLVFVRGGDHDANWPAEGNLAPDPAASPDQAVTTLWSVTLANGTLQKVDEGDSPAISVTGQVAYLKDGRVWSRAIDGGTAQRLFFDRGKDSDLRWSPDGTHLAFVSNRGSHAFIGIYTSATSPLVYLAPSTGIDSSPRWSPDGRSVAFVRMAGADGPPEPILSQIPHPWSLWTARVSDGSGRAVWQSPATLAGSYPDVAGEANLHWMGDRLVFLAYLDDWPHLYSIAAAGGSPLLLTPGPFMVEHVAESKDQRFMIYDANTGITTMDDARRHLFRVPIDRAQPAALTSGDTLEWTPVDADGDHVAFVSAGACDPPSIGIVTQQGSHRTTLHAVATPADFPGAQFVVPKAVTFRAADGMLVHGQLFEDVRHAGAAPKPGRRFPAWWTAAADAARLALPGVLQQRLCR